MMTVQNLELQAYLENVTFTTGMHKSWTPRYRSN